MKWPDVPSDLKDPRILALSRRAQEIVTYIKNGWQYKGHALIEQIEREMMDREQEQIKNEVQALTNAPEIRTNEPLVKVHVGIGDRVKHSVHGEGYVRVIENKIVGVQFDRIAWTVFCRPQDLKSSGKPGFSDDWPHAIA